MKNDIKQYLDWKKSYTTVAYKRYEPYLDILYELLKPKTLEEITIDDISKYQNHLRDIYSPSTTKYAMRTLRNFFKFHRLQERHCLNPEIIKVPKAQSKSRDAVFEEEVEKMVKLYSPFDAHGIQCIVVIMMLWDTGVRISELEELNADELNIENRTCLITSKKTGVERLIVWSERTNDYLKKYLAIRNDIEQKSNALFISFYHFAHAGKRLSKRALQRIIEKSRDNAGIRKSISAHSFRHGWVHKRLESGADIPFLQIGSGHINPNSTFHYTKRSTTEYEKKAKTYL